MISTSLAVRRRIALLAQQQPSFHDNRLQQQEGSTDFQWVQDAGEVASPDAWTAQAGSTRLPSHRLAARAPVIGTGDDHRYGNAPALPRRSALARMQEAPARVDTVIQQG